MLKKGNENNNKKEPNVKYVSMRRIVGKNLIPTNLVLYGIDDQTNEVKVYIFNKDMSKLKTFESFKNKENTCVEFLKHGDPIYPVFYAVCCAGTEVNNESSDQNKNNVQMELEWCHKDKDVALRRYCLNNETDIMNARFSSFTTIEFIEKFIEEKKME